jgi:3-dehydroquinate synthase
MENTIEISYKNNGTYKVVINRDYNELGSLVSELFPNLIRICIVSDSNVSKVYLDDVKEALKGCCETVTEFVFEAGEANKTLDTVRACYDHLLANDFNRRDMIVGLGGGVTGDVAAFIASSYMRGCRFINLPTSLLAMADSSVGGKCGVDYDKYKNIVGSIYMPSLVYAATYTLDSLPSREFSSGMAEILKAGLIRDAAYYEWLIMNFQEIMDKDADTLCEMLYRAVGIKQFYVTKDPFEENERMILNFGHTIGHALEKFFDFKYSHGECVALGSVAAAYISYKRSMLSKEEFYEIRDMFVPFNLPISVEDIDVDEVIKLTKSDKKAESDGIKFVLLKKVGKAVLDKSVSDEELKAGLNEILYTEDGE